MTKEEFLSKYDEICAQCKELENKMSSLREEYIKSNSAFPIGTKVKVYCPETKTEKEFVAYGIVDGYNFDADDDVIPILSKVKKNGERYERGTLWYPTRRKPLFEACD